MYFLNKFIILFFIFFFSQYSFAASECARAANKISNLELNSNSLEVKKIIIESMSLCPQSNTPKYSLAVWYIHNHKLDKALKLLKKIESKSKKTEYALAIAKVFYLQKRFDDSIDWYNESLRRDSKKLSNYTLQALQGLGAVYIDNKNIDEAKRVLETALKLSKKLVNSENTTAHIFYNLGLIHESVSDNSLAKDYFLKSLEMRKDFWQPYLALSKISYDDEESKQWVEKASLLAPDEPSVAIELASKYEKEKNFAKALKIIDKISIKTKDISISKAILQTKLGELDKSIDGLKTLSNEYPSDLKILSVLGWALLNAKYYTEAEIVLGNALALDAEHIVTIESMASLMKETGRLNKAEELIQKSKLLRSESNI